MEQPEGYTSELPDHVCRLVKTLYGLKKEPRFWFAMMDDFLTKELGFQSCAYDPCFYVKRQNGTVIMIDLYVYDLIIAASFLTELLWLKKELENRFEMTDCGEARMCLGLEMTRDKQKGLLKLSQSNYIATILDRFNMANCKAISTPMECQIQESDLTADLFDETLYRQAIGSMMYLMVGTRPDIAFAIGRLSQYMQRPTTKLWSCIKRTLRYLKGTSDMSIQFHDERTPHYEPISYCDSDWAGCHVDRKYTSGYVFQLAGVQ